MRLDLETEGRDPIEVVRNHPGYGLVALPVYELRRLGLVVVRSPIEGELCHGDIHGKKTKSTQKKLRDIGEKGWVRLPDFPYETPDA